MNVTYAVRAGSSLALMMALAGAPDRATGQLTGTVEGRVVDARTRKGVPDALISLIGQVAEARSDHSGFYRLPDVTSGTQHLRVERRGYATVVQPVEISPRTRANVTLFSAAAVLEAVVVHGRGVTDPASGTGAKRVAVRPAENTGPATGASSAILARVPGARVYTGGQVGSGSTIQIRGVKSFIAASDPVIYLDGIRVGGGERRQTRGYVEPSVLDQMDPASIDRIEVLPGAAAAMLYGEGAGNGVILIYTRRGGT